jgi:hypothetical protein
MKKLAITVVPLLAALALWLATRQPASPPVPTREAAVVQPTATSVVKPVLPPETVAKAQPVPEQPYFPPTVHDHRLAPLVDRNAKNRLPVKVPTASPDDFPALLSMVADTKDGDTERHEVAQLLIRSKCSDLPATLSKVLDSPEEKPRFRAFAMQYWGELAKEAPPEFKANMLDRMKAALNDKNYEVRCQALQNLCRLKDPAGKETAIKWLMEYKPACVDKDGKPVAPELERGGILNAAIRCCKDLDLKDQVPAIRPFARDSNEIIRIAAIVVLSDWRDKESLPAMQEAAESKSPRLNGCGKMAVAKMAKPEAAEKAKAGDKQGVEPRDKF